jgi:hypothetical protein
MGFIIWYFSARNLAPQTKANLKHPRFGFLILVTRLLVEFLEGGFSDGRQFTGQKQQIFTETVENYLCFDKIRTREARAQ